MVFPTKHAYVVKTKDDVCALLHIGIDTVKLNGEGFESLVQVGDKLAKVNLSLVKSKNLRTDLVTVILPESSKTTIETKFGTKVTTSSTKVAEVK
ncbi:PTS system, glucose-specific IIABC component [Mycoplasmopsis anatis]|nr:PTS system, glucose-specific IIABC component [Mycoplasmopsis anatis]